MEDCIDRNLEGFGDFWNINWKGSKSLDFILEKTDKGPDDIADLLPRDPFDMGIGATVTAITGWNWIEDTEKDFAFELGSEEVELKKIDDRLFGELNFVWNSAMKIHPEVVDKKIGKDCIGSSIGVEHGSHDDPSPWDGDAEEYMGFSYEKYWIPPDVKHRGCTKDCCDGNGGNPPDALFLALGYLGVKDLLAVERVCKSLHDAVQNDTLLWRNIHIDQSLSDKITDESLVYLTSRAQGTLRSLSLVECLKITDNGLNHVVESNPCLTKLSVAGCVRLSIEGILSNLKFLKSKGTPGIKYLRVGGVSGVTDKHFKELKLLLDADNQMELSARKPRFYQGGQLYLSLDDDCAIDIETCPRCLQLRQVYDCPAESCQGELQATQICRACTFCIARCINCGRCLTDCDYEETFCLDLLCVDCLKHFLSCQERQETKAILPASAIFHQQASYHVFLCG